MERRVFEKLDYVVRMPKDISSAEKYQIDKIFVAVPSAVESGRMDFVGFMMEAMAAYSHKELRPYIYETVLKIQRMNDAKSSAMVDVIMDGIIIDYAVVHDIAELCLFFALNL